MTVRLSGANQTFSPGEAGFLPGIAWRLHLCASFDVVVRTAHLPSCLVDLNVPALVQFSPEDRIRVAVVAVGCRPADLDAERVRASARFTPVAYPGREGEAIRPVQRPRSSDDGVQPIARDRDEPDAQTLQLDASGLVLKLQAARIEGGATVKFRLRHETEATHAVVNTASPGDLARRRLHVERAAIGADGRPINGVPGETRRHRMSAWQKVGFKGIRNMRSVDRVCDGLRSQSAAGQEIRQRGAERDEPAEAHRIAGAGERGRAP